ncbi:cyclic lactone autoinducer peptide [Clostridium sp. DSM 17811]|nr:cyclic lactone autoinducer peptide [Clostridium sp. DSM 17811]MBU3100744.1 cyclic lactone autoinducer peptide [Clostridium sp. DSM 17811]
MKNMKTSFFSNFEEKISKSIGSLAIKITDHSMGKCSVVGFCEPKFPIELLKEEANKNK